MLGLGVLFLSLYTHNANAAVSVLFGSILSVTRSDVLISLACGLVTVGVLLFVFRPLLFCSIDPYAAEARGVPVDSLSLLFLALLAMTISQAVLVVGVLLVFALLVVPAAAAERVTSNPLLGILLSISMSLLSTWGGLILAFIGHWPVSFYVVAITTLFYIGSLTVQHIRGQPVLRAQPHPNRELVPPSR